MHVLVAVLFGVVRKALEGERVSYVGQEAGQHSAHALSALEPSRDSLSREDLGHFVGFLRFRWAGKCSVLFIDKLQELSQEIREEGDPAKVVIPEPSLYYIFRRSYYFKSFSRPGPCF